MLPVKIDSYFDRPPPSQAQVNAGRTRAAAQAPKLVPVQSVVPEEDRRVSNRRLTERREKEQALFLDTRTPLGRRRSPGRRAEDHTSPQARKTISIKA
jgi:hypothetical protein